MSNGPMEVFNRKPKNDKKHRGGISNFDYTRNKILRATRSNTPIANVLKSWKNTPIYRKKNEKQIAISRFYHIKRLSLKLEPFSLLEYSLRAIIKVFVECNLLIFDTKSYLKTACILTLKFYFSNKKIISLHFRSKCNAYF